MRAALTHRTVGHPGLAFAPFAAIALGSAFAFGAGGCLAGMLLASLASFVVYLPLTALALNGGRPIPADGPAPAVPPAAQAGLMGAWAATAWVMAALAHG